MKNIRFIAVFILAALGFFNVPSASATEQTEDEINAILSTGTWHFQGIPWGNDRVFKPDRTFTGGGAAGVTTWKLVNGELILYSNNKEMKLFLPLDPKGTRGLDSRGSPVVIYQIGQPPPPSPTPRPGTEVAKSKPPPVQKSTVPPAPAVASEPKALQSPPPPVVKATPYKTPEYFGTKNPGQN